MALVMDQTTKSKALILAACPRLNKGVALYEHTWINHIKPFKHRVTERHFDLIKQIIENTDESQAIWYKRDNSKKMCIVKQVPHFQPRDKFILIALNVYSDKVACITSIYPVDELPSKEKGYNLL